MSAKQKTPNHCPYCQSSETYPYSEGGMNCVVCQDCAAEGPACETQAEAVTAWNSVRPVLTADERGALKMAIAALSTACFTARNFSAAGLSNENIMSLCRKLYKEN